jgi:tetratricopeptide (TPR) repeat protein
MTRARATGAAPLLSAVLLAALCSSACAPGHAARGRQALARGDHGLAIEELARATDEHPDDASLWRDLARAHMRAIEPQQAIEAIERAYAIDPGDAETALVRGQARLAVDRRDGALEDALFVLEHGTTARALQETAILLLRLHEADRAIAAGRRAIELSKHDPTAYANLAVLAAKAGRNDVAGQAFTEGRRIHPEHIGLAEAHAAWLIGRGEVEQARDVYRALLPVHPKPGLIHLAIALLSHSLGDLGDARVHSEAAVAAVGRERADVHYTHIVVLRDTGDLDEARAHLDAARRRFPGDSDLARLAASMEAP